MPIKWEKISKKV